MATSFPSTVIVALAGPPLSDGVLEAAMVGDVVGATGVVLGAAEADAVPALELSLPPELDPSLLHADRPKTRIAVANIALAATVSSRFTCYPPFYLLTVR